MLYPKITCLSRGRPEPRELLAVNWRRASLVNHISVGVRARYGDSPFSSRKNAETRGDAVRRAFPAGSFPSRGLPRYVNELRGIGHLVRSFLSLRSIFTFTRTRLWEAYARLRRCFLDYIMRYDHSDLNVYERPRRPTRVRSMKLASDLRANFEVSRILINR